MIVVFKILLLILLLFPSGAFANPDCLEAGETLPGWAVGWTDSVGVGAQATGKVFYVYDVDDTTTPTVSYSNSNFTEFDPSDCPGCYVVDNFTVPSTEGLARIVAIGTVGGNAKLEMWLVRIVGSGECNRAVASTFDASTDPVNLSSATEGQIDAIETNTNSLPKERVVIDAD